MKIYNQNKTEILENPNLELGKLVEDTIHIHKDEVSAVKEVSHLKTLREYPNGGKDVERVIEVPALEYQPAKDYDENVQVYIPYTDEELKEIKINNLRSKREVECFSVINRGKLWYDSLTQQQLKELQTWYKAWLDVTETLTEPEKPTWLKESPLTK